MIEGSSTKQPALVSTSLSKLASPAMAFPAASSAAMVSYAVSQPTLPYAPDSACAKMHDIPVTASTFCAISTPTPIARSMSSAI